MNNELTWNAIAHARKLHCVYPSSPPLKEGIILRAFVSEKMFAKKSGKGVFLLVKLSISILEIFKTGDSLKDLCNANAC